MCSLGFKVPPVQWTPTVSLTWWSPPNQAGTSGEARFRMSRDKQRCAKKAKTICIDTTGLDYAHQVEDGQA